MAGDPARLAAGGLEPALERAQVHAQGRTRAGQPCGASGSQAEIVVEDNGAGIRPDFLPYVFDRFQQADASRTRRFGGLGLGLSIVRNLVQFHGGTVKAESDGEGHGATFHDRAAVGGAAGPARGGAGAGGRTDAITDKRLARRASVCWSLKTNADAARVREAAARNAWGGGRHRDVRSRGARRRSGTARPDILISDIGLPEMDGYQLMEQIRQKEAAIEASIPAIALTAFARSEDRTRALLAGYQAHLAKPIESTELVATVASFAELATAQRARGSGDR